MRLQPTFWKQRADLKTVSRPRRTAMVSLPYRVTPRVTEPWINQGAMSIARCEADSETMKAAIVDAVMKEMDKKFGLVYQEDINSVKEEVDAVVRKHEEKVSAVHLQLWNELQVARDHTETCHLDALQFQQDVRAYIQNEVSDATDTAMAGVRAELRTCGETMRQMREEILRLEALVASRGPPAAEAAPPPKAAGEGEA